MTRRKINLLTIVFLGLATVSSCTDSGEPQDLQAPQISPVSGSSSISPAAGQIFSDTETGVNVSFQVADPQGVQEILLDIHGGFDGHSHGRLLNSFERLNVRKIFHSASSDSRLIIESGSPEVRIDPYRVIWEGQNSEIQGNVLAGPYHITISATDVNGNQTSFGDGSNYHTTFYIQRPYAPAIELTGGPNSISAQAGAPLLMDGFIQTTTHPLSTPLKFIWMRLTNQDRFDEQEGGGAQVRVFGEQLYGESSWRNLKGNPLPSSESINLRTLAENQTITVPTGQNQLILIIWAEDMAGNVTRIAIPVRVN
ncbi:DUF4625 domain-containing protein [Algoriphagus confluentis]|uniref:DUF4625 domain-containing protein n=1 Tax=Algoriphagus confluentis TaxID=1697556 RepID=A0ABQ6PJT5_9BACT|nr:hypothetical protein Aconfl_06510 [Algoriphagus confluentis]